MLGADVKSKRGKKKRRKGETSTQGVNEGHILRRGVKMETAYDMWDIGEYPLRQHWHLKTY